ncbi:Uncharacterized protein Rs2_42025 [Raphanus sativus]|uniref:Uncharacterized protein LOC108825551 isoform X2 n=1 Tax=Raphanus sativus TaxID=3726 RepID=A0A9W3CHV2_RAPSA|nr:uncharacterized protein LOC108825551 isoform X2 [Raphanus sativus]KAJ4877007.1 Uncharacterized protein Rs2_42025 [Raphanus sativus]
MRRGNQRAETLKKKKKTDEIFTNPDPSTSRDMKRKRNVTFVDVDHQSGPFDAKTSEFAFFNKLKSSFGRSSQASSPGSNCSIKVKQNPKYFESRDAVTDRQAKDIPNTSFSTPIHNPSLLNFTRKNDKDTGKKCSSGFNRDKDNVLEDNNNLRCGGSIDDKEEDFFSVKRKRLNQWVKHTWFPEIPNVTSNGGGLVSLLLTRLFPGTDERHPSRFPKERTDRVLDSPGSKFLKRSHESYTEADQMEKNRSIPWCGWLENSSAQSLQFATNQHVHSSFIRRDPQDFSFSISYPKISSVYRPPRLTQKASLSFPVEETLDSSLQFGNYKPLSLGYHGDQIGYSSEALPYDHREPSSALLLEWNTENASTRKTDYLQPSNHHTELITCPNASSSSLADDPWRSDHSSSHDVVTRELYPLPLSSHYTSGSFLLPATNQTSHFEHEFERHMIDEDDVVAANRNLQTFHHGTSSPDCLTRDFKYYHSPPNSPLDHSPFKVTLREIVSFPFSSISNSDLLETSSPTRSDRWWI